MHFGGMTKRWALSGGFRAIRRVGFKDILEVKLSINARQTICRCGPRDGQERLKHQCQPRVENMGNRDSHIPLAGVYVERTVIMGCMWGTGAQGQLSHGVHVGNFIYIYLPPFLHHSLV